MGANFVLYPEYTIYPYSPNSVVIGDLAVRVGAGFNREACAANSMLLTAHSRGCVPPLCSHYSVAHTFGLGDHFWWQALPRPCALMV